MKDLDTLTKWLSKRPGEFARLLDRTIRTFKSDDLDKQLELRGKVVKAFGEVAGEVATPILLQLRAYFQKRSELTNEYRVFFPKGSMAKTYAVENNLCDIEEEICQEVVKVCGQALINKYSEREVLGRVYIDEELKNFIVPTSLRNASKALKTVARGSRFKISEEAKVIRAFVYWKEPKGDRYFV